MKMMYGQSLDYLPDNSVVIFDTTELGDALAVANTLDAYSNLSPYQQYVVGEQTRAERALQRALDKPTRPVNFRHNRVRAQMTELAAQADEKATEVEELGPFERTFDARISGQTGREVRYELTYDTLARFAKGHQRPRFAPDYTPKPKPAPERRQVQQANTLCVIVGSLMLCDQWLGVAKQWAADKLSWLPGFGHANPIGAIALSK